MQDYYIANIGSGVFFGGEREGASESEEDWWLVQEATPSARQPTPEVLLMPMPFKLFL